MKILFMGPMPEPVTGHSLACQVLADALAPRHELNIVNLSKPELRSGFSSFSRALSVVRLLHKIYRNRLADVAYLTIAESLAGNIKDLLIYAIFRKRLGRLVAHLHGGSIGQWIFSRYALLRAINRWFLSRIGAVIVLGESHVDIFKGMVARDRIHIVPNFAEDEMFTSKAQIDDKFDDPATLRLLFLSNLIEGKGHQDIVAAYRHLDPTLRARLTLDFAGAFDTPHGRDSFLASIADEPNIEYCGVVHGETKKALLQKSHVFCLPTSFLEGQPISILEAYAAGCVVVTTLRGGIIDIFVDGLNGFAISPSRPDTLRDVLERLLRDPSSLRAIAQRNHVTARECYRTQIYAKAVEDVLVQVGERHD